MTFMMILYSDRPVLMLLLPRLALSHLHSLHLTIPATNPSAATSYHRLNKHSSESGGISGEGVRARVDRVVVGRVRLQIVMLPTHLQSLSEPF